ncbi:ANTAR domain-containing protein [Actinosynnema sp. NPDC023587]|uniref:ANTAR domain-containing protein n=1 Tax=Actinosynnema sp. NPDC023587 TaxID=3154695 RepID=UPI0033DC4FBA
MDRRRPDDERRARLWSRVCGLAADEGVPARIRHVCLAGTEVLHAKDFVVYRTADAGRSEPAGVVGPLGDRVSEAEITFGEGPAVDSLREEYPVVAADLAAAENGARWPVFTPFARAEGVAGVLAFPVMMGAVAVGCVEALRPVATPCTEAEVVDGLLLADAAMLLLLRAEPPLLGADPFADAVEARWATVHQATGVVSGQMGSDLVTAFVRLRAHAYRTGRRLADVANDVLARELRFHTDPEAGPDPKSGAGRG